MRCKRLETSATWSDIPRLTETPVGCNGNILLLKGLRTIFLPSWSVLYHQEYLVFAFLAKNSWFHVFIKTKISCYKLFLYLSALAKVISRAKIFFANGYIVSNCCKLYIYLFVFWIISFDYFFCFFTFFYFIFSFFF